MSILSVPAPAYPSPPSRDSASPEPYRLRHSVSSVSSSAMGGTTNNADTASVDGLGQGQLTYQRAIDIARNTEGDLDANVTAYLEDAVAQITNKLDSQPDSCLLTKDEFAVFNYFRPRFQGEVAERAVDRYWRSTHAGDQQQPQADRS